MKLLYSSLLALALAASTGCASSNRMMRFMPGGDDASTPVKAKGSEDRVNAWPVLNVENGKVAALWPMVDADKRGFAVRPLFNKEDSEYSILFPLCAWNPVNGDGWCLSAYWNKERGGFFPFAHFKRDGFNYVLPVFWNSKEGYSGSLGCYFSDGLNFAGPVWWRDDKSSGEDSLRCGFFPLFREGSSCGWLFPAYYRSADEDGKAFATPLGGAKIAKDGSLQLLDVLGPLYFSSDEDGSQVRSVMFPFSFFKSSKDGSGSTSFALPWFHQEKSGQTTDAVIPLYWLSGGKSLLIPCLLSYFDWEGGKSDIHVLAPFFHSGEKEFRLWPLVSCNDEMPSLLNFNKDGFSFVGSAFYKYASSARETRNSPLETLALSKEGASRTALGKSSHQWLLLCESSVTKGEGRILPFDGGAELSRSDFRSGLYNSESAAVKRASGLDAASRKEISECLSLMRVNEGAIADAAKRRLAKRLKALGVCAGDSDGELAQGLAALDAKHSRISESRTAGIPLVYKDKTEDGKGHGDVLWFLSRWSSEGDKSRFFIFEYMYRQEREGDSFRYDIFPFISVDKTPEYSRHSFLWRVLSWRSDKDGTHMNALFIPFDI